MKVITIVAISKNGIIGNKNSIPWHYPEELELFKKLTSNHIVIMGRKTFESIGKPLENRINIVISSKKYKNSNNIFYFNNIKSAKYFAKNIAKKQNKNIFIIGGKQIYQFFLPLSNYMYISIIKKKFLGDTYFPVFTLKNYNVLKYVDYHNFTFFKLQKLVYNRYDI